MLSARLQLSASLLIWCSMHPFNVSRFLYCENLNATSVVRLHATDVFTAAPAAVGVTTRLSEDDAAVRIQSVSRQREAKKRVDNIRQERAKLSHNDSLDGRPAGISYVVD